MKTKIIIGVVIGVFVLIAVGAAWALQEINAERIREADRFNVPVIEQLMPQLSNWNYDDLKPYLGKKFIQALPREEFQKELDALSILGKMLSFQAPRHVSHTRYKHWLYGQCAINKYSVSTKFAKDKGVVIFKLNHCLENTEVTFFQVHSKALPTNSPALQ